MTRGQPGRVAASQGSSKCIQTVVFTQHCNIIPFGCLIKSYRHFYYITKNKIRQ